MLDEMQLQECTWAQSRVAKCLARWLSWQCPPPYVLVGEGPFFWLSPCFGRFQQRAW